MKLCVLILIAVCVTLTTSVVITGEYTTTQWWKGGPTKFALTVGGVKVYKPNDYATSINAPNAFEDGNIKCLIMDFNDLRYMPGSYSRFFPGIEFLIVRHSHVKYVTNADFSGLSQLRHVDFHYNDIEHLPGNLFYGVSNVLQTVSFGNNKLTNIGISFFSHLPALSAMVLNANPCIDLYSPVNTLSSMSQRIHAYCQGSINPDVMTGPPPTYDEYKALNVANDNFKKTIENLTTELKLKNDKIKELETINSASGQWSEDIRNLTLELNAAKDEINKNNLTIDGNNEVIRKLNKSLTDSSEELDDCNLSSKKLRKKFEDLQAIVETNELINGMNKQTIEDLKKIINTLKANLVNKDAELVDVKKEADACKINERTCLNF